MEINYNSVEIKITNPAQIKRILAMVLDTPIVGRPLKVFDRLHTMQPKRAYRKKRIRLEYTPEERERVRQLYFEQGMKPKAISRVLGRTGKAIQQLVYIMKLQQQRKG